MRKKGRMEHEKIALRIIGSDDGAGAGRLRRQDAPAKRRPADSPRGAVLFYRSAFLSKRKVLSYQNTSIIWICLKFASIPEILRALRSGKKTGIPQKTCGITIRNVDLKVKNTNRIESAGNLAQNQNRGDTGTTDPPQQF